ncbi:MAG: hypothetical protein ABW092_06010 [Candidatus Thiodiazotropha sp.]
MELEERIENIFKELIAQGSQLKFGNEHGQVRSDDHAYSCKGWLTSAQNLVHLVVSSPKNPYQASVDNICSKERGYCIQKSVGEVNVILQSLLNDINNGLLASVENQTKALVFDDFLDHAKAYAKQEMKNEAGVIAGVVFEDTLRNICRNNEIEESGVKLDQLIAELTKLDVISQIKAKRARVAAHVRTKATHAQWEEFELSDVRTTIEFTEELINANIA